MKAELLAAIMSAICNVESGGDSSAINVRDGGSPSYGYCQIKLETARQFGFKGYASELWLKREVNYEFARRYFLYQYERYGKNADLAIAAYNSGSVRINPETGRLRNAAYVSKVKSAMRGIYVR
jgi:soluble lytic murein transglycosylase-like protein